MKAMEAVMANKSCNPPQLQQDPFGIVKAYKKLEEVHLEVFMKKAVLSNQELPLKNAVDKRFITYVCVYMNREVLIVFK